MASKIVLVTGGNNGIGYETVKAILQSTEGYHVLLSSRSPEKGRLTIENIHKECPKLTNTVEVVQLRDQGLKIRQFVTAVLDRSTPVLDALDGFSDQYIICRAGSGRTHEDALKRTGLWSLMQTMAVAPSLARPGSGMRRDRREQDWQSSWSLRRTRNALARVLASAGSV